MSSSPALVGLFIICLLPSLYLLSGKNRRYGKCAGCTATKCGTCKFCLNKKLKKHVFHVNAHISFA